MRGPCSPGGGQREGQDSVIGEVALDPAGCEGCKRQSPGKSDRTVEILAVS